MKKTVIAAVAALLAFGASEAVSFAAEANPTTVNDKKKKETKTVTLSANIHCKDCAKKVKENIGFEKGVTGLEVSVEQKTVKVSYDPAKTSVETLLAAMKKIGYPATVQE